MLYDMLAIWRERARHVTGNALPAVHFLPEEAPDQTCAELQRFFDAEHA
jgi:haloacetate dehalogenase